MENTHKKVNKSFARQFADYRNILLDLIDNTHVPRSVKEKEKIAQLELDGLAYMKSILEPTTVVNKEDFAYDDVAKTYFIKIGLELERKEQLKKNNANVLENTQAKLDLVALTEGLEKHLGLIPEFFLGTPLTKKPKPEPKLEEKPKVELNESFITQELTTQALRDADTKEIGLGNGAPIANGQVGASLVVDLDPKKIEATVLAYDKLLNPTEKKDEAKDKKEAKNETKLKNPFAAPSMKPSPEDTNAKKKKKKGTEIKPVVKNNAGEIAQKITALKHTVLKNQENAPIVLEQERFETLIKPEGFQISKSKSIERMLSMQQATRPGIAPNSIENAFGAEERKIKAKLK